MASQVGNVSRDSGCTKVSTKCANGEVARDGAKAVNSTENGAEVGGMLPPDIQSTTNFAFGIHSKDSKPAAELVKFMTTTAAAAVIKAKGLEPR